MVVSPVSVIEPNALLWIEAEVLMSAPEALTPAPETVTALLVRLNPFKSNAPLLLMVIALLVGPNAAAFPIFKRPPLTTPDRRMSCCHSATVGQVHCA